MTTLYVIAAMALTILFLVMALKIAKAKYSAQASKFEATAAKAAAEAQEKTNAVQHEAHVATQEIQAETQAEIVHRKEELASGAPRDDFESGAFL